MAGYNVPRDRAVNLLDLGCGLCEEASILCAFFSSGTPGLPTSKAKLYGVDLATSAIHGALDYSLEAPPGMLALAPNCEFIVGDATNLSTIKELPPQFDFIFIRHQFIASDKENGTDVWGKIFTEALGRLRADSYLMITSFSDQENEWLVERLQKIPGLDLVVNEKNPHSIPLMSTNGRPIGGDRWVALARRK